MRGGATRRGRAKRGGGRSRGGSGWWGERSGAGACTTRFAGSSNKAGEREPEFRRRPHLGAKARRALSSHLVARVHRWPQLGPRHASLHLSSSPSPAPTSPHPLVVAPAPPPPPASMVLIDGTKYACQSCIKGHRSSKCTHTARPLTEIKSPSSDLPPPPPRASDLELIKPPRSRAEKGRPTSQCTHCRTLRKTKSVHGRCDCAARDAERASTLPPSLSLPHLAARAEPPSPRPQRKPRRACSRTASSTLSRRPSLKRAAASRRPSLLAVRPFSLSSSPSWHPLTHPPLPQ